MFRTFFGLSLAILIALPGCSSSSGDGDLIQSAILIGTVHDALGTPLDEATIAAGSQTATTNEQGFFTLTDVPESTELVVTFTKDSFVPTSQTTKTEIGQSIYLEAILYARSTAKELNATIGGTIIDSGPGGGSVNIPAGALVDDSGTPFTGIAMVSVTTFDPTTEAGKGAFPGEFAGINTAGEVVPFASYGFIDVHLADESGNPLQIAAGQTATLTVPIPTGLVDPNPPATIPLWYFDPADGKWHEEGESTKVGNNYVGDVGHFSVWNNDVGYDRSFLTGTIIDCTTGDPVACAKFSVEGVSPRNCWTSGETCTPTDPNDWIIRSDAATLGWTPTDDGSFFVPVDANATVRYWAEKGGTKSEIVVSATTADTGQIKDLGTICIGTPKIKITLTWSDESPDVPDDLDSHLTYPTSGEDRGHVYFSNEKSSDGVAALDTDEKNWSGPEIITVFKLNDGVYRYSVHHYSGAGDMTTSGAEVNMIIDGIGIYNLTPAGGATGADDAWAVWDITVSDGAVTHVSQVNSYQTNVTSGDIVAFSP